MWRINCEQLAFYDEELAAKDEEIAELRSASTIDVGSVACH